MANRNTTNNADTISNAYEAGYRARQGAMRAEQEHIRRRINPGPRKIIPLWQGFLNLVGGLLLLGFLLARQKTVPHVPPSVDANNVKMAQAVDEARRGTYKGNGWGIEPEEVRRARLGIR